MRTGLGQELQALMIIDHLWSRQTQTNGLSAHAKRRLSGTPPDPQARSLRSRCDFGGTFYARDSLNGLGTGGKSNLFVVKGFGRHELVTASVRRD